MVKSGAIKICERCGIISGEVTRCLKQASTRDVDTWCSQTAIEIHIYQNGQESWWLYQFHCETQLLCKMFCVDLGWWILTEADVHLWDVLLWAYWNRLFTIVWHAPKKQWTFSGINYMKSWHTLVLYWMIWVDIELIKNAHVFRFCAFLWFRTRRFFISMTLLSPTENGDFITNFATQNHQTSKDILSTKGKRTIYSIPCRGYVFRIMALGDNYPLMTSW